ncbi:MAG: carbon-nitrogen hydrolase [Gracilibacter sp. BRH_c7a]|nr:MAG: carbon-nitrogen hydrolase [Gracilibacter sp. BRH_c7a]
MSIIKTAIIQMAVGEDKLENIGKAGDYLQKLADQKIDLAVLPEMFCCPYQTKNFPVYAEEEGGTCWQLLSDMAASFGIYLAAGSMPEKDEKGRIFNTAYVFDRQGRQIAKHRKMHLFDINVSGGQSFMESETLTAGDRVTVFDTEFGKMGLCICYDFRFPELARLMVNEGAKVILVPAAFNMTTGPAHWEIMFRQRAVDNQVFTIGAAPARDPAADYISWGHSIAVAPWGNVLVQLDDKEGYTVQTLDLGEVDKVRRELPLLAHRRSDIYTLCEINSK